MAEHFENSEPKENISTLLRDALKNETIYLRAFQAGEAESTAQQGTEATILYSKVYHKTKENPSQKEENRIALAGYRRVEKVLKSAGIQFEDAGIQEE